MKTKAELMRALKVGHCLTLIDSNYHNKYLGIKRQIVNINSTAISLECPNTGNISELRFKASELNITSDNSFIVNYDDGVNPNYQMSEW